MNTMGAMGSFASSLLFPILISWTGNIAVYFYLAALLNIVGLACWRYIEPARSLIQEES
jgi:predicted small integral membrane protein